MRCFQDAKDSDALPIVKDESTLDRKDRQFGHGSANIDGSDLTIDSWTRLPTILHPHLLNLLAEIRLVTATIDSRKRVGGS